MKPLTLSHRVLRKLNLLASFFLCLLSSFLALRKLNYPLTGIDDANIYFVYAKNLVNGYGFVYNAGGERVEGFTSLLWTLISALAFKVSTHTELILLVIDITLISLGIFAALNYLQDSFFAEDAQRGKLFWSITYLLLIFMSPRYIVWNTITLMENALWSTLLLLITIFVSSKDLSPRAITFRFIPLTLLLLLTRPESILWVAVFTLVLFLRVTAESSVFIALKRLLLSVISTALVLALLTLFRLSYFGYPLPNTFYAKVSPSFIYDLQQGTIYLIRYFLSDPIVAISIILILSAWTQGLLQINFRNQFFFLPMIAVIGLLVPVLTGGDHFGSFRFYQNIYPIEILCVIYIFPRMLSTFVHNLKRLPLNSQTQRVLLGGAFFLLSYGFVILQCRAWSSFVPEINNELQVAQYERRNGAFIQDLFSSLPHLPSIGVIASGGIKYSYRGDIVDLFGLNNTTMAHNHGERIGYKNHSAFEVKTFYLLEPDIVWPIIVNNEWQYNETELRGRWENVVAFKGLFNDPGFLELYKYAKVSKASNPRIALVAWFKKDFLKDLIVRQELRVEEYEYSP